MATNRNKMIREMEGLYQSVTLPDGKDRKQEELFAIYDGITDYLGIRSRTQLEALRKVVVQDVMRVQEEILTHAAEDFVAGTITEEQMPLRRVESPDGGYTLENVPPELLRVASFMAWLNEKVEE